MKAAAAVVAASGPVSRKAPGRAAAEASPSSAGIFRVKHQSASSGPSEAQASAVTRDRARIFSISAEPDTAIHLRFRDFVTLIELTGLADNPVVPSGSRYQLWLIPVIDLLMALGSR